MMDERDERPRRPPDEPTEREDTHLGYAEDAGHPGGEPDLDEKTETEGEHE
jgi:hypothetical protein